MQAQEDDSPTPSPFDPSQFQEKRMELKNEDLLMKCKDLADDSEECTRIRDFAFSTLKQNLDQMLNGLERHLLRMLDAAVDNGSMTQEEADEIIDEFEVVVEELEAEFERSESAEDLQNLVQGYRRQAKYKELLGKISSIKVDHRYSAVDNALGRLEKFIERIEVNINAAKAKDLDTEEAEGFVTLAAASIDEAKELVEGRDVTDYEESKEVFFEVRDLLRSAHSDLKAAVKSLIELYKEEAWEVQG